MHVYYHGTTHSSLSAFQFGIQGVGECSQPVNGVWLSQRLEGAENHAALVKYKRNTTNAYIYEITLTPCTKIADATEPNLPDSFFKNFRSTRPLYIRPFIKNNNWYSKFYRLATSEIHHACHSTEEDVTNRIIELCKISDIDGILNPVVSINNDGSVININEPMYGKTLLLFNLTKVASIKLVKTI